MTGFINTRFPVDISRGARGGPQFQTRVITTAGGYESRNIEWSAVRGKWNVGFGARTETQIATLLEFFYAMQGRANAFRFRDPLDYRASLQTLQTNAAGAVQFCKVYTAGGTTYRRWITLPVSGTVTGLVGGSSVDYTTGIVTGSPAGTTVTFEFDCKCRFDTDFLDGTALHSTVGAWDDIPIIEVR